MINSLNKRRAIVVGGSLGGLFAANMLLRKGWDVEVFERVPDELAGRGAGIVTHPELFEAMAAAGIPLDASVGIDVLSRVTLAQDGDVVLENALPQTLTAWGRCTKCFAAHSQTHCIAVVAVSCRSKVLEPMPALHWPMGRLIKQTSLLQLTGFGRRFANIFYPMCSCNMQAISPGAG
nr:MULTISPECIES: hypothetical protein [unclassified Pseudomonas]